MNQNEFNQMVVKGCVATMEQGLPALEGGSCKYLTESGLRCVVGHMMTEEECKFSDGYILIRNKYNKDPFTSKLTKEQVSTLDKLQEVHDSWVLGEGSYYFYENSLIVLEGDTELHGLLKEAYDTM